MVYLLGLVSFLMDVASEMVYPLLPLFLASLGGGAGAIGLVEGVAEATAIGLYHTVVGILLLPASLIFGFLWQSYGPELAFGVGAGLALLALLLDGRRARP
nr:hypothetical protein [Thermus scotoductus]